jgi:hypothetical protein
LGSTAPAVTGVGALFGDTLGVTDTGVAEALGFGAQGPTLNEQLAQLPKGPEPTTREQVTTGELKTEKDRLRRVRASQTLFTGSQGILERPSVASTTLLGF